MYLLLHYHKSLLKILSDVGQFQWTWCVKIWTASIYFENVYPFRKHAEFNCDKTKLPPEPVLTYHQMCSVAFTWEQFHKCRWTYSDRNMCSDIALPKLQLHLTRANELTLKVWWKNFVMQLQTSRVWTRSRDFSTGTIPVPPSRSRSLHGHLRAKYASLHYPQSLVPVDKTVITPRVTPAKDCRFVAIYRCH